MHDIGDLELRGVPAGDVRRLRSVRRRLDRPVDVARFSAVARVFTPHPIQDRTDAEMIAYIGEAFDEILAAITDP